MGKQFWMGLIVGIVICGIIGALIGLSMVGKKAIVEPSKAETFIINHLKNLEIPESPAPATPVERNDATIMEGGEHFSHHCAPCHDLEGDADSKLAKAFYPPIADLTANYIQNYSDGQLKWIVDNGIRFTGMPGWKDIIDEPTQWKIVYYIRALADPVAAEKFKELLKDRGLWETESFGAEHHHETEVEETEHGDVHEEQPQEESSEHGEAVEPKASEAQPTAEQVNGFDVVLEKIGPQEIDVIKEVRSVTGLGLEDAKALVDNTPSVLKRDVTREEAEQIKDQFSKIGAEVEIM